MIRKGDKVIAIVNHSAGKFNKDDEFTVDGFGCCPHCGQSTVYLKGFNSNVDMTCNVCDFHTSKQRECFLAYCFIKKPRKGLYAEHRLKIDIPELIEMDEHQLN